MLDRLFENIMCSFNLACNIKDSREISERINIQTIYSSSYLIYKIINNTVRIDLIEYIQNFIIPGSSEESCGGNSIVLRRPIAMFSISRFKSHLGKEKINIMLLGGNINECYSLSVDEFCMPPVNRIDREKVKKMLSYFEFNRETMILLDETIEKLNLENV